MTTMESTIQLLEAERDHHQTRAERLDILLAAQRKDDPSEADYCEAFAQGIDFALMHIRHALAA